MTPRNAVLLGDCIERLRELDADSVDAIVTDPPYFRVKGETWDRAWDDADVFVDWLGEAVDEFHRVLTSRGSLYIFASSQMAARVEAEVERRGFVILNRIVWDKGKVGWHAHSSREALQRFHSGDNERIIFAAPLKGVAHGKNAERGYENAHHALAAEIFAPLRKYLAGERNRSGLTNREIDLALGTNGMAGHWFDASQWAMPTRERYRQLRVLLNSDGGDYLRRDYDDLRREYDDLRREYDDLRREYDDLRRPFDIPRAAGWSQRPHGEVWRFAPLLAGRRHICEKPQAILDHIVLTSTKPGDLVLDGFAGSGSLAESTSRHGRDFLLIERDPHYYRLACLRAGLPDPGGVAE